MAKPIATEERATASQSWSVAPIRVWKQSIRWQIDPVRHECRLVTLVAGWMKRTARSWTSISYRTWIAAEDSLCVFVMRGSSAANMSLTWERFARLQPTSTPLEQGQLGRPAAARRSVEIFD